MPDLNQKDLPLQSLPKEVFTVLTALQEPLVSMQAVLQAVGVCWRHLCCSKLNFQTFSLCWHGVASLPLPVGQVKGRPESRGCLSLAKAAPGAPSELSHDHCTSPWGPSLSTN